MRLFVQAAKQDSLGSIWDRRGKRLMPLLGLVLLALAGRISAMAQSNFPEINEPPHDYQQRTPHDGFTQIKEALELGQIALDHTNARAFVLSLLKTLNIPASSQMLVFSTTSLQLSLISPANPRALYFNEDAYLGYVPGGRIEIVSLDPELGGIYYIFDVPREGNPLRIERSERCMNCHAGDDTGHVPGLVLKSVLPGPTGGSLTAYRLEQMGHSIPFEQRFGGWYVTGQHAISNHLGNLTGQLAEGVLTKIPNPPGERFSFAKYPAPTSDVLPQLLLEHQAGFVNRVVQASYRARAAFYENNGKLTPAQSAELDEQAVIITRYLLFADEAPLPPGGVEGDATFKTDFLRARRTVGGASLKDFDLRTRLFKNRCSYMIYGAVFTGLPPLMKERVYRRLDAALSLKKPDPDYGYLPSKEKQTIRRILAETLTDLPAGWQGTEKRALRLPQRP